MIHANSDAMRQWLWKDTLSNTSYLNTSYCILHAIASVLIVYLICICIDYMRIKYIEQPFFKSDLYNKIENKVRGLMDVF